METTVSLVQGVLDVASKVSQLGDNLFVADQAWLMYRGEVRSLQGTLDEWSRIVEDYDLQDERNVVRHLEDAKLTLENAHTQLTIMETWEEKCGCCWHFAYAYAFPRALERSTEFLKAAGTNLSTALAKQAEWRQQADKLRSIRQKVESNNPLFDGRYVPLKGYQDEVYQALRDARHDAPFFIFLHGEQGIGKTTLAWHIAADSKKSGGNPEKSCSATNSRDISEGGVVSCPPPAFDYVFFISCGLTMKGDNVRKELERRLELNREAHPVDIFKGLGKDKKVLLVLDDVQDPSIPKMAMEWGGNTRVRLRIFITSNKSDICDCCDDKRIFVVHLRGIDKEDARKILANHVGLSLPERGLLKEMKEIVQYMDKVVEKTRGNPLALSCFASRISKGRVRDVKEWESALEIFETALRLESRATIYQGYPTSFWGMMRLCMEGLGEEAGKVLLLSHIFKPHMIQEEAVQLLYVLLGLGSRMSFQDARNILESRHLIMVRGDAILNMLQEGETIWTWDIHPLRRLYIDTEGVQEGFFRTKGDMENLISGRLRSVNLERFNGREIKDVYDRGPKEKSNEDEEALLAILCTYYLQPEYGSPAQARSLFVDRCRSLYPLLARPLSDKWTTNLHRATEKDVTEGAEFIICFWAEIVAEALKMRMQGKSAFKVKRVLQILEKVTERAGYHRSFYSLMLEQFCHALGASPDAEITTDCCHVLYTVSNKIVGILAIIRQPKIISHLMTSARDQSNLVALKALRNLARSEQGCRLILSERADLLKVVETCKQEPRDWELVREVGYLLSDLAIYKTDALVTEGYLTGIFQTMSSLYTTIENHAGNLEIVQLNLSLSLLYYLTLSSDIYQKLTIGEDRIRILCRLMDIHLLRKKKRTVALWIRLMANLARCSDSKQVLQEHVLLRRGLRQLLVIVEEDQRLMQAMSYSAENIRTYGRQYSSSASLTYADEELVTYTFRNAADEDEDVTDQGFAVEGTADEAVADRDVVDDDITDQGVADEDVAVEGITAEGVSVEAVANTDVADENVIDQGVAHEGIATKDVSDKDVAVEDGADMNVVDGDIANASVADLDDVADEEVEMYISMKKYPAHKHRDPLRFTDNSDDDVICRQILSGLNSKQRNFFSLADYFKITSLVEVLTLLGSQEDMMTYMKDFMAKKDMRLVASLSSAKAKIFMGDLDQSSAHLEEASFLTQGGAYNQRLVNIMITKKQCFIKIMLRNWDEALQKVNRLSVKEPILKEVYVSFQRGMIHKARGRYDEALRDLDDALCRALEKWSSQDIWSIVKQIAHVKYLAQDRAGAEKDLLNGARWIAGDSLSTEVFFGIPTDVGYLEDIRIDCVEDFLYSDDFYERLTEAD